MEYNIVFWQRLEAQTKLCLKNIVESTRISIRIQSAACRRKSCLARCASKLRVMTDDSKFRGAIVRLQILVRAILGRNRLQRYLECEPSHGPGSVKLLRSFPISSGRFAVRLDRFSNSFQLRGSVKKGGHYACTRYS